MLTTVDGIVIGIRNAGENGGYLDILTKEYGVVEVITHGVKKINSKHAGASSLFSYSLFCLSKNGLKYTMNSASPKHGFHGISESIERLSLAAYFAETVKYVSASEQYESDMLRFFAITLYELEKGRVSDSLIKSVFELRLCALIGLMPDLRACRHCACYTHDEMYFMLEESNLICGECFYDKKIYQENGFLLPSDLLYALRYITYSELNKIYKIKLTDDILINLSVITEKNLLFRLGREFKTLNYYKKLLF